MSILNLKFHALDLAIFCVSMLGYVVLSKYASSFCLFKVIRKEIAINTNFLIFVPPPTNIPVFIVGGWVGGGGGGGGVKVQRVKTFWRFYTMLLYTGPHLALKAWTV